MQPLKSVSGVIAGAGREAHVIVTDYACCDAARRATASRGRACEGLVARAAGRLSEGTAWTCSHNRRATAARRGRARPPVVQEALDAGRPPRRPRRGAARRDGRGREQFRVREISCPTSCSPPARCTPGWTLLRPLLARDGARGQGRHRPVQGRPARIGKNLVGIMLKGAGFEVVDLGNDVLGRAFRGGRRRRPGHRHVRVADDDDDRDEGRSWNWWRARAVAGA